MRLSLNRRLRVTAFLTVLVLVLAGSALAAAPERVNLVLLATSDLHGHIYPIDYFTGAVDQGGLAQVATVVNEVRTANPNVVLVDNGDVIEGGNSTLPVYYQAQRGLPNPMAVAMNYLKYDSMTVGNHEFNYGKVNLKSFARDAAFPVISANVLDEKGTPYFRPYTIKTFSGVSVGIIGITTPKIPIWEKPENIAGLKFADPVAQAKKYAAELRSKGVDVVVIVEHTGWEQEPKNALKDQASWLSPNDWVVNNSEDENFTLRLANQVPDVDVIISGHSHSAIPITDSRSGKIQTPVIITQPGSWGDYLSRVDVTVEGSGSQWKVVSKTANIVSMNNVEPDPGLLDAAKIYHDTTWNYYTTGVGTSTADMPGGLPVRFYDNAQIRLINEAQLWATGADISLAALFSEKSSVKAGPMSIQQIYGLYIYSNTLYKIQITGAVLRAALEQDATYFNQYTGNEAKLTDLVNPLARGYNWDIYAGIQYKIDISKPVGQRVAELKFKGKDVTDDMTFTLAVNNYRAGGGGGFTMFRDCKVLWTSEQEVRQILVDYMRKIGTVDPAKFPTEFELLPAEIVTKFGIKK